MLDKPLRITAPSRPDVDFTIHLWPGILKTTVCLSPRANRRERAEGSTIFYLVTIPSIQRTYLVPQTSIIPFQAFRPHEDLLVELRSMGKDILLNEIDHEFDPLPRSSTLESPLSLGAPMKSSPLELLITDVGIARQVASVWTATDKYSFPDPGTPELAVSASPSLRVPHPRVDKPRTGSGSLHWGSQGIQGYRGLWWGAERVWVGDLLRLSFSESSLNFAHANPSHFTDDVLAGTRGTGDLSKCPNPEDRYAFLKLKALVPRVTSEGTELYATGDLYKLTQSPTPGSVDQRGPEGNLGLPRAPEGFTFNSILSADVEAQFSLNLVRGRYYPRLLSSVDRQSLPEECGLKLMEGFGSTGSMTKRPIKYRPDAREVVMDAARSFVLG